METPSPALEPLLIITGPTASGKSGLAVAVAERLHGEIVSADAFAVYRGLDIGTDKPDQATRRRIRHHLLDVADPRDRFSAGAFDAAARAAIAEIRSRGPTPIVAGGTLLYLRSLLLGLFPSPPHDPLIRAELAAAWGRDPHALYQRLRHADPGAMATIGPQDRQRILRALEVLELTGQPISELWRRHPQGPRYRPLLVVPAQPRADLYARINARVDRMFSSGLEEETSQLLASGIPRDAHAFKAIGYRQVVDMLEGRWDRSTAITQTKQASRRLAKRQLTWLRTLREGTPLWVPPVENGGAEAIIGHWDHHVTGGGTG